MADATVDVVICNRKGLHARAAAKVASLSETLGTEVFFTFDGQSVSSLSIMGLMLLGASVGTTLTLSASGDNAPGAVESMAALVRSGFHERE